MISNKIFVVGEPVEKRPLPPKESPPLVKVEMFTNDEFHAWVNDRPKEKVWGATYWQAVDKLKAELGLESVLIEY